MTDDAEWGPWIEHDGRGCPVQLGTFVHAKAVTHLGDAFEQVGCVRKIGDCARAWDWSYYGKLSPQGFRYSKIIRYRIRKPRALKQLRDRVKNLPAPTERVDA